MGRPAVEFKAKKYKNMYWNITQHDEIIMTVPLYSFIDAEYKEFAKSKSRFVVDLFWFEIYGSSDEIVEAGSLLKFQGKEAKVTKMFSFDNNTKLKKDKINWNNSIPKDIQYTLNKEAMEGFDLYNMYDNNENVKIENLFEIESTKTYSIKIIDNRYYLINKQNKDGYHFNVKDILKHINVVNLAQEGAIEIDSFINYKSELAKYNDFIEKIKEDEYPNLSLLLKGNKKKQLITLLEFGRDFIKNNDKLQYKLVENYLFSISTRHFASLLGISSNSTTANLFNLFVLLGIFEREHNVSEFYKPLREKDMYNISYFKLGNLNNVEKISSILLKNKTKAITSNYVSLHFGADTVDKVFAKPIKLISKE